VAAPDVVWLADCIGGDAQIDTDTVRVELRHAAERLLTPRTFINPVNFGPLLPEGTVLRIGAIDFRLDRRG
jgi:hypothetical protein